MEAIEMRDAATGLPGPDLFRDRLDVAVKHAQRTHEPVALMHVGIDTIEPERGGRLPVSPEVVDVEIARRLTATVRAHDSVARLGPSLFGIIASGDLDAATLRALIGRLLFELSPPIVLGSGRGYPETCFVTASVGAAIYVPHDMVCDLAAQAAAGLQLARAEGRVVILDNRGQRC
ncbi:diguanylate cyclase domain-containing protein [Nocardioides ultimimeridianus]